MFTQTKQKQLLILFINLLFTKFTFAQNVINTNLAGSTGNVNQNINANQQAGTLFTGTGNNPFYGVNMVPFGPEAGDLEVAPGFLTAGQTIDLYQFFPFYGGLYNYTTISVNGYMAFATVLDQGPTINVGPDSTDWPRLQDPAMIAPWLCKQQINQDLIPGLRSGVFFRLILRQSLFGQQSNSNINEQSQTQSSFFGQSATSACPGTAGSYVRCDGNSDFFLDQMQKQIQEGVAGGNMFRPDAAVIVTWYNTGSAVSGRSDLDSGQLASYQVVWLTDAAARLSYAIINYDKLGFDAADFRQNSRSGRCRGLFNGGNHTGLVDVDPTQGYKNSPKILAQRSGVPHIVRGRYLFRVDDVVRPAGCSNKTGGTYPMLIYPNIINMLGEMTIDVNAMCLDRTQTYILMIERRQTASCVVLNPSIARCTLPRIYDWGTKTLYFQPQSGGGNDDKAFVGYAYFVPPTLDPMRLDIGNIYAWYQNPIKSAIMPLTWYPRNFTNPDINILTSGISLSDSSLYSANLGLYVIGYKEAMNEELKKFSPVHRVLCRLASYTNRNQIQYSYTPQEETININQVQTWYMSPWERNHELYSYRFGYLKLAPTSQNEQAGIEPTLLAGLTSAPISLHWLWSPSNQAFAGNTFSTQQATERTEFITEKATQMCHDWYDEDGALDNFVRDTETNSSCPCIETQARMDLGRFMPHPRCSQEFRDITCTELIGSENCYMSASNVYASYMGQDKTNYGGRFEDQQRANANRRTDRYPTHNGQVCCYDAQGFLMQTPYQPVVRVIKDIFYNPGFPNRAFEFGSTPYLGQFEVPGLSVFHHDLMPYYLCCKYSKFRCQMFYWRRPSSACQNYQPPAVGKGIGAGVWHTIDNQKFIFNEPGVYNLLYIPQTETNPEIKIQVRTERYPNRKKDWSNLGHYDSQADLVQPTNATVITGIALEATGTDRVVVTCRGDTRRFRYRTNIFVKNILRYFDTMRLQRFEGVLVYVNNVVRGIPDIYVVLEEAEIGIRIKESYSIDIDRYSMYQESMGILDIELSVPPRYGVTPNGENFMDQAYRTLYNIPRVSGLLRPYPDQTMGSIYNDITLNDVNSDAVRSQIINNYRIAGTGGLGSQQNMAGILNNGLPTDNMFTNSRDEDTKFEVFPEVAMKNSPIYSVAPKYSTGVNRFRAMTGTEINQLLQNCRDMTENYVFTQQPQAAALTQSYARLYCPDNPAAVISECGDSVACLFDWALLNSRVMALELQNNWNAFTIDRNQMSRTYNSCGAINIEYPEYLTKTPSFASAYLQGDTARFGCDQTHWIHGEYEYKCSRIVDYNDPTRYRYEWNKGNQPWCRSRQKENYLKWLAIIFGFLGAVLFIFVIFMICFVLKKRHQKNFEEENKVDKENSEGSEYEPKIVKSRSFNNKSNNNNDDIMMNQMGSPTSSRRDMSSPRTVGNPELRNRNSFNNAFLNSQPQNINYQGFNTSV
uniref:Protein mesh n=1 Tax=Rhabditophanes sp. KR3021 TaxID=114890 RepID=A0AC35U4I4_9BILA